MIDFHTHILPCIDDGSQSLHESLSLIREEGRQGIDAVVMTPHFYADENDPATFLKKRNKAWKQLAPYLWSELPKVYLGAEVQYFEGICAVEDIQHLRILGTEYLLLEMPFARWSDRMLDDVLELNERDGMQVVLAHIERYMAFNPDKTWSMLREHGVLMQSNVSFFENWKTRRRAMSMLERGEINLLGSDCHNKKTRRPNWLGLPPKAWKLAEESPAYNVFQKSTAMEIL